jgi:hypothetical protein
LERTEPQPESPTQPSSASFTGELELDLSPSIPRGASVPGAQREPSSAFVPTATLSADPSAQRNRFDANADADGAALGIELSNDALPPSHRPRSASPTTSHSGELSVPASVRAPTSQPTEPARTLRQRLGSSIPLGIAGVALIVGDAAVGSVAPWGAVRLAWVGAGAIAAAVLLSFWRLLDDKDR